MHRWLFQPNFEMLLNKSLCTNFDISVDAFTDIAPLVHTNIQ